MTHGEEIWVAIGVFLTAIPTAIFVLLYGLTVPWYRSATGRAIMILAGGIAILVATGTIRIIVGQDSRLFLIAREISYTLVPIGMWYLLLAFIAIRSLGVINEQDRLEGQGARQAREEADR